MGLFDIFASSDSLQERLDNLERNIQDANENNKVIQEQTALFEKYGSLFDDFQREILEPRKIALAKELVATPDVPEHRDGRLEIRGAYFELEGLIQKRAVAESKYMEFLNKKAQLLKERNEVEAELKKRLEMETRRTINV